VAPREFNPRYEADFAAGADYDPDRQRSSQRKLQRQLVKEKRGAMRELRRDAKFMSSVSSSLVTNVAGKSSYGAGCMWIFLTG
jgi:hypothetical protein